MNAVTDQQKELVQAELKSLAPHKSTTLKKLQTSLTARYEKAGLSAPTEIHVRKVLEILKFRVAIRRGVERVYFSKPIPEKKEKVVKEKKEKAPKTPAEGKNGKPAADKKGNESGKSNGKPAPTPTA